MRVWLLFGYFIINSVFCCAQSNEQFGIRAATITYVHSGSSYGTSTLYFDDFGDKKLNQTIIRADSTNGRILISSENLFINNKLISDNNAKTTNSLAGTSLANSMISTSFTNEMLNKLGFLESGKCIVAGKLTTKYCSHSDTICLWNGIVLKASMHLSVVSIKLEATLIDLKPPPDTVFHLKQKKIITNNSNNLNN
jgi:hypothetical protein